MTVQYVSKRSQDYSNLPHKLDDSRLDLFYLFLMTVKEEALRSNTNTSEISIQFIATEIWLYDSPPIIGEIYRQFVDDCYKKNLLIRNEMTIGKNNRIDLSKIKHPFLVAIKDDLVAPQSSRAINDIVGSTDKSIIEFNSGHVGTCISSRAHEELWHSVGNWLKQRP